MSALIATAIVAPLVASAAGLAIRRSSKIRDAVTLAGLAAAAAAAVALLIQVADSGTHVVRVGGWDPDIGIVLVADLLAVLVLPIMIITASEALRAVPDALRQASMGVGATKWETIRYQVFPVALPAILTGTVLTIARAFGESAPLLLAGAVLSSFFASADGVTLFERISQEKYTALPIIVFNWARQPQEEFRALTAAAIIVLLVLLLVVNATAIILRDRFERV